MGQELRVGSWPEYIAPDTITNFKALCGVNVDYRIYSSSEELFAWLNEGQLFDIVIPTSSYVLRLIQLNKLYPARRMPAISGTAAPRSQMQITHTDNLNPDFLNFAFDPENRYTTPYAWGTTGVISNVKTIG